MNVYRVMYSISSWEEEEVEAETEAEAIKMVEKRNDSNDLIIEDVSLIEENI